MNFGEMLALAKAGFKASEIKEFMALEKETNNDGINTGEVSAKPDDIPSQPTGGDNPPLPVVKEEDAPKASVQPSDKEKQMQSEIESLKNQIAKLQADNQHKDLSGEIHSAEDDQKQIDSLVRSFM